MRRLAAASLVLLLTACGEVDPQVMARNLETGEVQSFSSEAEVPDGWVVCPDATCTPPGPCESLGSKLCTLNPECRLKTLWCSGEGSTPGGSPSGGATPGSASDDFSPPGESCETTCIPRLPLLCEELDQAAACQARSDCEWGQFLCPAIACAPGTPCPPCAFSCQARAPQTCDLLAEADCKVRNDCTWGMNACPACIGPECDCKPLCQPAELPLCGPNDCGPALGAPNYLCPDGKTVAGPGPCVRQPSGSCGWMMVSCPEPPPPPAPPQTCKVTGCSGTICAAQETPSTCEWADHFQCYTLAICGLKNGVCGWTETAEFNDCMAKLKP